MSIVSVFCDVDDFCITFESQWHRQLICHTQKPPVISKLSLSEIMTIIIYFHQSAFRNFKHYYQRLITPHKSDYFPNLVSYNRFVELMKQALIPLAHSGERERSFWSIVNTFTPLSIASFNF